jgi:hypothetical protein
MTRITGTMSKQLGGGEEMKTTAWADSCLEKKKTTTASRTAVL